MQPFWAQCENRRLAALWREGAGNNQVWVFCTPFAEEEKCARRTLTDVATALQRAGHSSLLFAYSGTGDSEGDFAAASLEDWRSEIMAMCALARQRAPQAALGLLGVRLGASLAAQVAQECGTHRLTLLEPVLDGSAFLAQLGQRRRLRAMLTDAGLRDEFSPEDLDGWPLGKTLKDQLEKLQLDQASLSLPRQTQIWQIGGRRELAPALHNWAEKNQVPAQVLLMPPFWNRLDAVSSASLIEALGLDHGHPFENEKAALEDEKVELESEKVGRSRRERRSADSASQPYLVARDVTLNETPLLIPAKSGALVGMLHLPPDAKNTLVLMLHGWSGYRTGPHQMQTRAARQFAQLGFPVLRFDFGGRGDSDGDAELATLATMEEDVASVLQWIENNLPAHRVVLGGLCSGCEVAFAAAAMPAIHGLILWSAPVFAAGASAERTRRKRWHRLGEYARKLLRPATYAKLARGGVDVRGVTKVLSHQGGESKNVENDLPGQLPRGWRQGVLERNRTLKMPVLMVYGDADPTAVEALAWYENKLPENCPVEQHWVAGANHSYYGLEWERNVIERTCVWLNQYFG